MVRESQVNGWLHIKFSQLNCIKSGKELHAIKVPRKTTNRQRISIHTTGGVSNPTPISRSSTPITMESGREINFIVNVKPFGKIWCPPVRSNDGVLSVASVLSRSVISLVAAHSVEFSQSLNILAKPREMRMRTSGFNTLLGKLGL